MGFDQYHEPPEELPPETRTFARLCASLTEEAEAIGWYEQRLAVETDPEAAAVMRDAVGEEYKHFAMDLEFLLRRTPKWRETARGILFQRRRHRRARRGGRGGRRRGRRPGDAPAPLCGRRLAAARYRLPEGRVAMSNHLLRSHAPISDAAWREIDEEARERLVAALAARKLVDFSGPHGWEYSATTSVGSRASRRRRATASPALQRRVLPLVELRADFTLSRASCAMSIAARPTPDLEPLDGRAPDGGRGERGRVPRLGGGRDHRHRRGLPHSALTAGRRRRRAIPARSPRAVERLLQAGSPGLTRSRSAPTSTARGRDRRARRLSAARPPRARSSRARSPGRPVSRARSCSACAAATSCSNPARICRSATSTTIATPSRSIWSRASASTWPRLRPRCRSKPSGLSQVAPAERRVVAEDFTRVGDVEQRVVVRSRRRPAARQGRPLPSARVWVAAALALGQALIALLVTAGSSAPTRPSGPRRPLGRDEQLARLRPHGFRKSPEELRSYRLLLRSADRSGSVHS